MPHRSPTLPKSLFAALRQETRHYGSRDGAQACATIASYNIHKCVGTDGVFDPVRIAHVLSEIDADVIAVQEADERTGLRHGLLDLALIEKMANLVSVYTPENRRSHGWHGNLILARNGVVSEVKRLKLPGLEPRGALIVDLELKGYPLRIIAAHLGLLRRSRSQQTSALLDATEAGERPTIILGDLNEWRVRNRSSLLPLLPHFGPIHAVLPSFPSRFPLLALDRILARPAHLIAGLEVHHSPLARVASDHLPVKARLKLVGQAKQDAEGYARA